MEQKFTHLHLHTTYSLLDGFCNIKKLVARIKELGMTSVAITDHGVMFGVIDFYKACLEQGIKPILGCEVYMAERSRFDKDAKTDRNNYHLVLLAKNNEGYQNLSKIVSEGYTEGFYFKPRVDFEVLKKYSEGIIALTACIAGRVPSRIIDDRLDEASEELDKLIEIFGRENVYAEIQDHGLIQEKKVNEHLIPMAKEKGIKVVATNDSHYIYKKDAEYHDVLLCVQMATTIDDPKRMRFANDEFYVKSQEEMEQLFSYIPEAITNTAEIAERCNIDIEFHHYHLPKYDVPEGYEAKSYLRKLCEDGLKKKYGTVTEALIERMEYELGVIDSMGFNDYFLIVWDFIKYAKDTGIAVGPGRGSAAGSIVSYALNITEIDPIKYNLVFERFLNSARVSMPDIDIDFCYENRHRVIEYVIQKYGEKNVSQIITFGTLGAKQAIRDVGRSLGMSYGDCDKVAKEIPSRNDTTIESAINESTELQRMIAEEPMVAKLIEVSKALEGCQRHCSTHAAGVVISDRPVSDYVPMYVNDGNLATQFTMTTIEELGLLKMDFLGLRNLTVIKDALNNIKYSQGIDIDISKISMDDQQVYKLISKGDTTGVFQLESSGMRAFMQNLQPDTFEDIIAGISLYRPGPMQYIDTYVANKRNPSGIQYISNALIPILNVTYGCMVYQEQVMQIVRDLAGFSLSDSDNVRRAMSKKKHAQMVAYRDIFVNGDKEKGIPGCVNNGINAEAANKIYDEMMDFASYAFNKSHAAAYAVVSFQTAYLKTYYPTEFMAALLTSVMGFDDKIVKYIRHLKEKQIDLLSPDVNESFERFTVSNGKIRYGLLAVKSLGENAVQEIIRLRREKGNFTDFADFVKKMDFVSLNKRGVENLIKSGAFGSLGHKRKELMSVASDMIENEMRQRKKEVEGQVNMFDLVGAAQQEEIKPVAAKSYDEFPIDELLAYEKESMGLYISGHPLKKYESELKNLVTHDSVSLMPSEDDEDILQEDETVICAGIITGIKSIMTKSGKPMAFVQLEDVYGSFELTVFQKTYEQYSTMLKKDNQVLVKGRINKKDEMTVTVIAQSIADLNDKNSLSKIRPVSKKTQESDGKEKPKYRGGYNRNGNNTTPYKYASSKTEQPADEPQAVAAPKMTVLPEGCSVIITLNEYVINFLDDVKKVLSDNNGDIKVILYDKASGKKYLAGKNMWIRNDIAVIDRLRSTVGADNVKIV